MAKKQEHTRLPHDEVDVRHQLVVKHGGISLTDADLAGLPVGIQRRGFGMIKTDRPWLLSQRYRVLDGQR